MPEWEKIFWKLKKWRIESRAVEDFTVIFLSWCKCRLCFLMDANRVTKRRGRTECWTAARTFIPRVQFQSYFLQGLTNLPEEQCAASNYTKSELQTEARRSNDHQSEVISHIQGVYFDIHLYYYCNSCYTKSLMITLSRPWPIQGCRAVDDIDDDIPNKDTKCLSKI